MLACAIASERLEAVPGWDPQVRERRRSIQLNELAKRHPLLVLWEGAAPLAPEEPLGLAIAEAPDHEVSIT